MRCENNECMYCHDHQCKKHEVAVIGRDGICQTYEKGFQYYFYYFTRIMRSNFICLPELDADLKYCIYYLMRCLPIEFNIDEIRGILLLRNSSTKQLLSGDDILDLIESSLDEQALHECIEEFITEGLPNKSTDNDDDEEVEIEYKEYGWLSPTGIYTEAEFGDHEDAARDIINNKDWADEYHTWIMSEGHCIRGGDFLSQVKGYALIHDPSGLNRYIVTNMKPLTKKQREFLYGFFMDMKMTLRAEEYLED